MRLLYALSIFVALSCTAGEEQEWGKIAKNGLHSSVQASGEIIWAGPFKLILALHNPGERLVKLPAADEMNGWLFIAQGRQQSYFSDKVKCVDASTWPPALEPGKTARIELDLGQITLNQFRDIRFVKGYPSSVTGAKPQPKGKLNRALDFSRPATLSWIMLFPGDKVVSVGSNKLTVKINAPTLSKLPQTERDALVARLIARYKQSAYTAQSAHNVAVSLGKQVVDDLIPLLLDSKSPSHTRVWLVATLSTLGGDKAVKALLQALDEDKPWMGMGYHCSKVKNPKLSAKLVEVAMKPGNEELGVWTIRGMVDTKQAIPETLLVYALKSKNAKLKNYAIVALGKSNREEDVSRLRALVASQDERARASAAAALANARPGRAIMAALVEGIAIPGKFSQQRINDTLSKLAGNRGSFQFNQAAPQQAVSYWQKWWQENQSRYK